MSNVPVTLTVPSANGVGAAVDVSGLGVDKTVILAGTIEAIVLVEASVDGGTTFCQVAAFGFTELGQKSIEIAAQYMRVQVQGYKRGSGSMTVGGQSTTSNTFASLTVPAADGVGAAVDVSGFGNFWTAIVGQTGRFKGAIALEISQDNVNWAQSMPSFNGEGCASKLISAQWARVRRTGYVALEPGPLTMAIGAGIGDSTSAGGGTLNDAYDFGGAGAGRVITADAGAAEFRINALGTTTDDAVLLNNTTAAILGTQQVSPSVVMTGRGFATTPALSRQVDAAMHLVPVQGTTAPTGYIDFAFQINGGGYVEVARLDSGSNGADGQLLLVNGFDSAPAYSFIDSPGTGMWLNGTDELQFSVAGNQAFRLPSTRELYLFQSGSVSSPAYSFNSDTDLGIYRVSADRLGIAVGNTAIAIFGNLTNGIVFARQAYTTPFALTDGANIALNAAASNIFTVTLAGNRTLDNPTNVVAGMTWMLEVTQDGTGSRTLAFGANYTFGTEGAPTLSTTPGTTDIISMVALSATKIACTTLKGFI